MPGDNDREKNYLKKLAKVRVKKGSGNPGSSYNNNTFTSSGGSGSGSTVPRGYTPASSNSASSGWSNQGKKAQESNTYRNYLKVKKARGS